MANYWIKMYMEILDDPKMATLPDRLWRRAIELFLVAGRTNQGGEIPDTAQIAWMLRMSTDDLAMDLRQIESVGIITRTQKGWMVNNFAKRQAAVGGAERIKAYREREHHSQYTSNENVTKRYIDTETDKESYTDKDKIIVDDSPAFDANPLSSAFVKASGIMPYSLDRWLKSIEELAKMGAAPDDVTKAVANLPSHYKIAGPWSIQNAVAIVMAERSKKERAADKRPPEVGNLAPVFNDTKSATRQKSQFEKEYGL